METFIARRLYKSEQGSRSVSRPAVLIAQIGVALGLAVMLITIANPKATPICAISTAGRETLRLPCSLL